MRLPTFTALAITLIVSTLMSPAPAQAQLLGDSGVLSGLGGSLLGGSRMGLGGFNLSLGLSSGVITSTTSSSVTSLTGSLGSTLAWRSPNVSLVSGLDAFTRRNTDVADLLSRFDGFGFPGAGSPYSLSPDHLLMPATSGLSTLGSLAGSSASPLYYGWTPSGYVMSLSIPALRDFGPLGALLQPAK